MSRVLTHLKRVLEQTYKKIFKKQTFFLYIFIKFTVKRITQRLNHLIHCTSLIIKKNIAKDLEYTLYFLEFSRIAYFK